MYDYFVFQSFFHDFFLVHLLFSSLLFSSLFSCLVSPLTCLFFFFFLFFFSFLSSLVSFSSFSFSFSFSLFRLLFSLFVFFLRVVVVCVSSCVCVCVCGVVWCAVWCGTLKTPCVDSKTPPCVDSKRPRVCRHHAQMLKSMCAWCQHTRGRFESTHGGVFESTHGWSSPVQFTKKFTHVGFSLGPTGSPKVTTGCCPCSSLRKDREQHVPDSFNHSLYLIKLFNSSYPEGNFGGNQLLDGSISLSPLYPSITNDLRVSIS